MFEFGAIKYNLCDSFDKAACHRFLLLLFGAQDRFNSIGNVGAVNLTLRHLSNNVQRAVGRGPSVLRRTAKEFYSDTYIRWLAPHRWTRVWSLQFECRFLYSVIVFEYGDLVCFVFVGVTIKSNSISISWILIWIEHGNWFLAGEKKIDHLIVIYIVA